MHLDPNMLALATVTCGIGCLMTVAGLGKGALELRRRTRKPARAAVDTSRHAVCSACS